MRFRLSNLNNLLFYDTVAQKVYCKWIEILHFYAYLVFSMGMFCFDIKFLGMVLPLKFVAE